MVRIYLIGLTLVFAMSGLTRAESPTTQPAVPADVTWDRTSAREGQENPVYEIYGVKRSGVYSLGEKQITLRQALISSGSIPMKSHTIWIRRQTPEEIMHTVIPAFDLFNGQVKDIQVQPGDILMLIPDEIE